MVNPLTVAFVLASYAPNAPAGMERATAGLAQGLRELGHRSLLITAAPILAPDTDLLALRSVEIAFPCDDQQLRHAISTPRVAAELRELYREHRVDIAVCVDALWGLGRIAPPCGGVRSVLAMHVLGHDEDLHPALARTDLVIAPSLVVLGQARDRGYQPEAWQLVPNPLLHHHSQPTDRQRETLRQHGPIRILARVGPEKNIPALLAAGRLVQRPIEVAVGVAGFEPTTGRQAAELDRCRYAVAHLQLGTIHLGLDWAQVPSWLAQAAAVIVPSVRESFGLVALEAMSVGTPVIAFDIGNLPALIGTGNGAGGAIVPRSQGEHGLWQTTEELLADPVRYAQLSRAAYYRSRDYLPTTIAETFLKAVR
jgi:iron(II)-dependent oxidoreductase